jgi:hypothetical protein
MQSLSHPHTLRSAFSLLRSFAALAAVVAAVPATAQGYLGEDPSLRAKYQCSVLGDTSKCATAETQPAVRVVERVVLGPRAKHLIYLGTDPAAAAAQARLAGEVPVRETVRITTRALSSAEVFDRANGRTITQEQHVEVLSSTRVLVDADAVAAPRS